jgi:hypothetical protein
MKGLSIDFILHGKINFDLDLDLESIGGGITRKVYKVKNKPQVLKITKQPNFTKNDELGIPFNFNPNKIEWDIWNSVKNTPQGKYFAECIDISVCGQYLLMTYAPKSSNAFVTFLTQHGISIKNVESNQIHMIDIDLRNDVNGFGNWGILNQSMVIVDYGHSKNIKYLNKKIK